MTTKDKLDNQFKSFSLKPVDRTSNLAHLYADYFELEAIFSNGDEFTTAELINRFKKYDLSPKDLFDVFEGVSGSPAEMEDAFDTWAAQVVLIAEHRWAQYGEDYPFDVDNNSISLRENLSVRQKLYIFLLLCSNLNYFGKVEHELTSEFEQMSFEVLTNFLPEKAVCRQLGKNSDYTGDAQEKLRRLSAEMNVDVKEKEFRKIKGTNERGVDVVGWIPFNDRYASFPCFLGQCACGKKWFTKFNETRRFECNYFDFGKLNPTHVMFVPSALFFSDDFFQSDEIINSLMFERFRMLEHITNTDFFDALESKEIVDFCINFEADLV